MDHQVSGLSRKGGEEISLIRFFQGSQDLGHQLQKFIHCSRKGKIPEKECPGDHLAPCQPAQGTRTSIHNAGHGDLSLPFLCRAMTGNVLFQDALAARLDIMKPSASDLQGYLSANPPK